MSRILRKHTSTGIYHVMLRGINKQNIFFSEDDYCRMMEILHDAPYERNKVTGEVMADDLCVIYAYCILDNHVHVLIREGKQDISDIMQKIEIRYALYYNKKYERVGHLFQSRFESEPVNDSQYFYTLLRYIHRNPVKALEARTPEAYPYSSWNEYVSHPSNIFPVLKPSAIKTVKARYPLQELIEWVNEDVDDKCLDMDNFPNPLSDREAFEILTELSSITNPEDFRLLDSPTQIFYLLQAIDQGITLRQASRLGTITYYQIRKALAKKCGESSTAGPGPSVEKTVEKAKQVVALNNAVRKLGCEVPEMTEGQYLNLQEYQQRVRMIEGLGKKTYHKFHLIVEFLFQHPNSKCKDVATHLDISTESARRFLIRLANENIVDITGKSKQCTYSLK